MGGKSSAPSAPDYTEVADASKEAAHLSFQLGKQHLEWAKQQDALNRDLLNQVLETQLPAMEAQARAAEQDRQRYEEIYQPIESKLAADALGYDTPAKRELAAGEAQADVQAAFEQNKANARQQLEAYGIDPSQTRYAALDRAVGVQQGAALAGAGQAARRNVENTARALQGEAVNIGRGYPSQIAQSYGQAVQAGQVAQQGALNTTATAADARAGAVPYFQTGTQAIGQWGNTLNAGYQNQLAKYQADQSQSSGLFSGLGTLAGAAFGSPWVGGLLMEDGGEVPPGAGGGNPPIPGSTDNVPAALTEGEYIIPENVVRYKGVEFFDKLLAKFGEGPLAKEPEGGNNAPTALPVGLRG